MFLAVCPQGSGGFRGRGNENRLGRGLLLTSRPALNDPIFTPEAARLIKRRGEISLSGENFPQPANQCAPQPTPYVLWLQKIEFIQKQNEVVIL